MINLEESLTWACQLEQLGGSFWLSDSMPYGITYLGHPAGQLTLADTS